MSGVAASAEEKMLFLELFRDYVPEVRPRLNPQETITIEIDFQVNQIRELVSFVHCHVEIPALTQNLTHVAKWHSGQTYKSMDHSRNERNYLRTDSVKFIARMEVWGKTYM